MLKLLNMLAKTGTCTIAYPYGDAELMPSFRGKPVHYSQKCIACAACAMACPANALSMETDLTNSKRIWQFFAGRCIFCGRCEEVCPARAIRLSNQFELAVRNKQDLYERSVYRLAYCQQCGQAFAPEKEVEHALLITQQNRQESGNKDLETQFFTCPACKRQNSLQLTHFRKEG